MVQVQGNNIMAKMNILRLAFLLMVPVVLSACTDKDDASEAVNSVMEQEEVDSKPSSQDEVTSTSVEVDLQDLMHQQAQVGRQADKHGFVWSTTHTLIENGYAEAKEGNEAVAKALFQEAILQYKLSIEQGKYAEQHLKLLIPQSD
jgi:hypothetical protein